jgi:NADH-quinone oxidoreductase subunit G
VVDICPVGALTSKDFRFKMRVWFMKSVKSVCAGCSNGCNTFLDQKDGVVYRYRPRQNMQVNDYWMCDEGRLSYKAINDNRLASVRANGKAESFGVAFRQMVSQLQLARQNGSVVAVGSAHSSLEDNFVLKGFMNRVAKSEKVFGVDLTPDGYADDFLIKADKAPNRAGLRYLGLSEDRAALLSALSGAQFVILMNNNLAADPAFAEALRKVPTVLYLGTHADETAQLASYVFPVVTHAEKYGCFVNYAGRVQRFYQAFEAPGDALAEMEFLSKLGRTMDQGYGYDDIEEIWGELRAAYPELGETSWYGLGDEGFQIPSLRREPAGAVAAER